MLGGLLAVAVLTTLLFSIGENLERISLILAALTALLACYRPQQGRLLTQLNLILLSAATLSLVLHFILDHFKYRYVWLYSSEQLPIYLKIANLWGGDEGTLLLLATLFAVFAQRLLRYPGWAAPGTLLFSAAFAFGASYWSPFLATAETDLAHLPSQGMNVHLMTIWMALHPPLILLAYALILAPCGAALELLAKGNSAWPELANRYSRTGWLMLSMGLAAGMVWAYEDFTFGQFWHWDPVQTSVFIVWALSTASLHGLRYYSNKRGYGGRSQPLLALCAAAAALIAMLITRDDLLASSHRYIGDTSQPLFVLLAGLLLAATVVALWAGRRHAYARSGLREPLWRLRLARWVFIAVAALACWQLIAAYTGAWLEQPRPTTLKPFFELLTRWSPPQEATAVAAEFARWDVDNFALNAGLAPLGLIITLLGGYTFLPLRRRRLALILTVLAALSALVFAYCQGWFERFYDGTGLTSRHTVAIFFWLDAMLFGAVFLLFAVGWWLVRAARHAQRRVFWAYSLPIGLIHTGVMIALLGALSASVLDSYTQQPLNYPEDFAQPQRFAGQYTVAVDLLSEGYRQDGGRRINAEGGFYALGKVHLYRQTSADAPLQEIGSGQTLFRDQRQPFEGKGPLRQLCEIVDYRYARFASDAGYRLDPFIERGFWRDVQVWLPAVSYRPGANGTPERQASTLTVVIKTYPLLSWLWIGLSIALIGALLATVLGRYRLR